MHHSEHYECMYTESDPSGNKLRAALRPSRAPYYRAAFLLLVCVGLYVALR